MTRVEAITRLVEHDLPLLDAEARASHLLGWWHIDADDPEWHALPEALQQEMARTEEPADPMSPRYESLLRVRRGQLHPALWLGKQATLSHPVKGVFGRLTLSAKGREKLLSATQRNMKVAYAAGAVLGGIGDGHLRHRELRQAQGRRLLQRQDPHRLAGQRVEGVEAERLQALREPAQDQDADPHLGHHHRRARPSGGVHRVDGGR